MSKWLIVLLAIAALAGVILLERSAPTPVASPPARLPVAVAPPAEPTVPQTPSETVAPPAAPAPQTSSAAPEAVVAPTMVETPAVRVPAQTPSDVAADVLAPAPQTDSSVAPALLSPAPEPQPAVPVVVLATLDPRWAGLSLAEFLDRASGELVRLSPESVTDLGIASALGIRDDRLDPLTAEWEAEYYDTIQSIVDHLATYDLDREIDNVRLNAEIYGAWLRNQLPSRPFANNAYYVSSYMDSYPPYIEWFMTSLHPLETPANVEDYLSRLSEISTRFRELEARLAASETLNAVPPRFMLDRAVEQIRDTGRTTARETSFYQALSAALESMPDVSPAAAASFREQAAETIETEILPAYLELAEYVSGMAARAGDDAGVWKQTNGAEYYADCLRSQTTTNLTPDEIYDLGVGEVARIEAEIRTAAAALGFDAAASIPALFDQAAAISGTSLGDDTIARCQKLLDGIGPRIAAAFTRMPTRGLIVVDGGDYAYFSAGTLDGSRPGQFFAPTLMPQEIYGLPTLTYHEGVPGHGFQAAYAQEADIPPYVAGIGFTAFDEGWALYAERLAWELGAYDEDAYGNLGRLQDELFRAVRLVVDPGLHAKRWTYEQAVAYMLEHLGYDEGYVRQEVERYIVTPGQAVTYKVGMLRILELRERAKAALGAAFSLAGFHDVVIGHGSLPLDLLARRVDEYIDAALAGMGGA